jgi:hypothetical protein
MKTVEKITPALTEAAAIDALIAVQKSNGDAIDPAGARRLVRALVALGLLHFP